MKQFSSEAYFVVGFSLVGGSMKHGEVRFLTQRGAMRHVRRLFKVLPNGDMAVFMDRVGVMGPLTFHREEEGSNRRPWLEVDVEGRVWAHNGLNDWQHLTMIG